MALNCGSLVLALPLPVTMGAWCAPMILTPRKHHSPSDTTTAEVANDLAAQIATASVKGCLAKQAYCGVTLRGGLHRGDERHLVLRAATALAPGALATEVGVVDLHAPVEHARVLALAHDLHELVLHEPGALVANAQVTLELQRRDVVLGLGEQVHGQEPACQRQLGGFEDRAADGTALVAAPAHCQ